jgi:hypothetical protein
VKNNLTTFGFNLNEYADILGFDVASFFILK